MSFISAAIDLRLRYNFQIFQLRDILKVKLRTAQGYVHIKYNKYFSSNEFLNHTVRNAYAHISKITDQMTKHKIFFIEWLLDRTGKFQHPFLIYAKCPALPNLKSVYKLPRNVVNEGLLM